MILSAETTVAYAMHRIAEEKNKLAQQIPLCGNCQKFQDCKQNTDVDPEDVVCLEYKRREE